MKRLLLLMAALLACGLLAAGCGDDDDDDGGSDEPAATETVPAPTDTSAESEDDSDVDVPPAGDEAIDQAIEACKDSVQATAQQLDADLRSELEDICEEAASGDEEDVREASLEICKKIVEDQLPAGAGRDQALETCESTVPE